ncbi:MAG: hypothetical protein HQK50_16665, partial [Oligoflexia bacterium]|nr:hypothetical protein [Oligoflexia bacterium]
QKEIEGAEQSGHIENIGLELYMELLQEAILEIKGERSTLKRSKDIEIQTPFAASIPSYYIQDSSLRLKYYKKMSNCSELSQLSELQNEMNDIFGELPNDLYNLFITLEVRLHLQKCAVSSISVQKTTILLKFDKNVLESEPSLRDKVISLALTTPKSYQIHPDYSLTYKHKDGIISENAFRNFAKLISEQIVPC